MTSTLYDFFLAGLAIWVLVITLACSIVGRRRLRRERGLYPPWDSIHRRRKPRMPR